MNLTITRGALLKALSHATAIAEKRNTIPILANVMLTATRETLQLTATDMEIAVVEDVSAAVGEQGSCTAPAATLHDIVRKLGDGADVNLSRDGKDGQLLLRAGNYRTRMAVLPVEDFPSMKSSLVAKRFSLPAKSLCSMIDRARFAMSTEGTRYYLNGLYLHQASADDGTQVLRVVATDGHRLARVDEPLPEAATGIPGVIVPRRTVNEIRKLLDGLTGDVEIALSETSIQFTIAAMQVTSKLVDGTFPEYDRVIPRGNDIRVKVRRASLTSAVARVAAISSERERPVKLSLSRGSLILSSSCPESGTATEELDGDDVEYAGSTSIEVGFQARYLSDIADQISGDVEFGFANSEAPALIVDPLDTMALYVLMPMRV